MNCEDFNKIIHELADYKPMQVTVRDDGVSHVALCADCATKLASARILSTSLVTAAGAESEEAPARIKQNLLAAFTSAQNKTTTPRAIADPDKAESAALEGAVVAISIGRPFRWWTAAAVAVAAVILLAVVVPNWRKALQSPSLPPASDLKAGLIDDSGPARVEDDKAKISSLIDSQIDQPFVKVKPAPVKRRWSTPRRTDAGRTVDTNQTVAQNTGEYLPLTYLAKSTAIDSGTIVRVELSRSALASLGIRTNFEGTGKSVKADVVIGDDGVAQAIRLVQ